MPVDIEKASYHSNGAKSNESDPIDSPSPAYVYVERALVTITVFTPLPSRDTESAWPFLSVTLCNVVHISQEMRRPTLRKSLRHQLAYGLVY